MYVYILYVCVCIHTHTQCIYEWEKLYIYIYNILYTIIYIIYNIIYIVFMYLWVDVDFRQLPGLVPCSSFSMGEKLSGTDAAFRGTLNKLHSHSISKIYPFFFLLFLQLFFLNLEPYHFSTFLRLLWVYFHNFFSWTLRFIAFISVSFLRTSWAFSYKSLK